jgi:putative DNA primase/helicase
MEQTRQMLQEAAAIDDEALRKPEVAWALKSDSHERRAAMLKDAGALLPMPSDTLDSDPYLFNVENGTLDLRTGLQRPHNPADRITKLAPVVYDPTATAATWDQFLARIFTGDRELIRFIQRAVGYSLTGLTTEQVMFLLWGTGQNGKSTFITTLQALFGDYARQTAFDTFLAASKSTPGAARPDIVRLRGARLISALEAPAGARLAETVVKSLTGGDIISARDLYSSGSEFRMEGKLWLAANNKPEIRGTDLAIWRRIRLVPFTVTIPEEEKDPQLADKLRAELPGILNWAVEGLAVWQREGLGVPVAVERATAEKFDNAAFGAVRGS